MEIGITQNATVWWVPFQHSSSGASTLTYRRLGEAKSCKKPTFLASNEAFRPNLENRKD